MVSRELDQLLLVARHYLSQARRASRRQPAILDKTLREVTDNHTCDQLRPAEFVLAHLASCAIRLATVCEKEKARFPAPYRSAFYHKGQRKGGMSKKQITEQITRDLDQHVHFLLRDNVAHEENVDSHGRRQIRHSDAPDDWSRLVGAGHLCAKDPRLSNFRIQAPAGDRWGPV